MTPATLQALRRLLFFSVDEAARLVAADADHPAGVSPRSWQYWERGERPIPKGVTDIITRLCAWRAQAIAAADTSVASMRAHHGTPAEVVLVWYQTPGDWATLPGREPLQWRPQCSVVAEIAARHGGRLVTFDGPVYTRWRGRRADSEMMRGEWAASTKPSGALQ